MQVFRIQGAHSIEHVRSLSSVTRQLNQLTLVQQTIFHIRRIRSLHFAANYCVHTKQIDRYAKNFVRRLYTKLK